MTTISTRNSRSRRKAVVVKAAQPIELARSTSTSTWSKRTPGRCPSAPSDRLRTPNPRQSPQVEPEAEPAAEPERPPTSRPRSTTEVAYDEDDGTSDEYEYVDDTSGLESEDEPATAIGSPRIRLGGGCTSPRLRARGQRPQVPLPQAAADGDGADPVRDDGRWLSLCGRDGWWACGIAGVVTMLYLAYLRRQTRIEEQVRRRRMQRMARSRVGVENTADREYDGAVAAAPAGRGGAGNRRRGSDFRAPGLRAAPEEYHLPRAAGQ